MLNELEECPRCKLSVASDAEALRYRQRERKSLFATIAAQGGGFWFHEMWNAQFVNLAQGGEA